MGTRGAYRAVFSVLFDDPDYQWLPKDCRLLLLTLRLCKQAGPSAIFRYYPAVLSAQTGLTVKQIEAALVTLREREWIDFDETVVWVRNGLRYDPHITLADSKHRKAIEKYLTELPRSPIVLKFCDYYQIARAFEGNFLPFEAVSSKKSVVSSDPEPENLSCAADAARQVLDWLNQKTGKGFRPVEANLALIRARISDGVADWQLKAIVSEKTEQWAHTDMAKYLRPATLFNRTKCEQYLAELRIPTNGHGRA